MSIPKKRGRPKKARPRVFVGDADLSRIELLSSEISNYLGPSGDDLGKQLAVIAIECETMQRLRNEAPTKRKTKGNRQNIHVAILLKNCAKLHEQVTGEDAKATLAKLGGWAEDAVKDHPTSKEDHPILKYARAVLATLGIKHASLRRQVRQALGLFE